MAKFRVVTQLLGVVGGSVMLLEMQQLNELLSDPVSPYRWSISCNWMLTSLYTLTNPKCDGYRVLDIIHYILKGDMQMLIP